MPDLATTILVAASFLHLGFQAVVTVLVYPTFARIPDDDWGRAHAAHSRRIAPLVVVVYAGLAVAGVAWVRGGTGLAGAVSVTCAVLTVAVTAVLAAPAHVRLGEGRDPLVLHRLLRADRARLALAVIGAGAAVWSALGVS